MEWRKKLVNINLEINETLFNNFYLFLNNDEKKTFIKNYEDLKFLRNIIIHPNSVYEKNGSNSLLAYWEINFFKNIKDKKDSNSIFLLKLAERNNNTDKLSVNLNNEKDLKWKKEILIFEISIYFINLIANWINNNKI